MFPFDFLRAESLGREGILPPQNHYRRKLMEFEWYGKGKEIQNGRKTASATMMSISNVGTSLRNLSVRLDGRLGAFWANF